MEGYLLCGMTLALPLYCSFSFPSIPQVGSFLHFTSVFVAGMIVGFIKVWQLALVVLAVLPLIATSGAIYAIVLGGLTSKEQEAYAGAGDVAQQVGAHWASDHTG